MSQRRVSFAERVYWTVYLAAQVRGQAGIPFRPAATIQQAQTHRLHRIIAHAQATVPYYRETLARLGLGPADFRTADDLARLPLLERDQVRRDPEYFVATAQPLDHYLCLRSSGTSGRPKPVYCDIAGVLANAAHAERERSIVARTIGKPLGYRELIVAPANGAIEKLPVFLRRHTLAPPRGSVHRRYAAIAEPPARIAAIVDDFRPDLIHSFGSYLSLLFAHWRDTNHAGHRPAAVFYNSDVLTPAARRLITDSFGIPVFSAYQAMEAFKIGFECDHHTGLHLNLDLYPVRIIDGEGRTVSAGESGEVVVSNLVNRATVLLNYRLGDLARRLPSACPCGRTLPLLSFPEGRSDDVLTLAGGRRLHPQAVNALFRLERDLWQHQVVQATDGRISVFLVPGNGGDREPMRARIAAAAAALFGPGTPVDVIVVDAIERAASGKTRAVIAPPAQAMLAVGEPA